MRLALVLLAFLSWGVFAEPALADCVDPSGIESQTRYDGIEKTLKLCDGEDWVKLGGAGLAPFAPSSSAPYPCDAAVDGTLALSSLYALCICRSGVGWVTPVNDSTACVWTQDDTPDAFVFTDLTEQSLNTQVSSNIVTIGGIGPAPVSVSVSGTGTPQISINSGGWTASGSIVDGQTLQARLTSSASPSTAVSATVTVGTASDQWQVTTLASLPGQQLFTSSATFTVPAGVTSISAVCVGAGATAPAGNNGGRGGDLRYAVSLAVTPGEMLNITAPGSNAGAASIVRVSNSAVLLSAAGGAGRTGISGASSSTGGNIGGGDGGIGGSTGGGGGGAGGYSGNGGAGGSTGAGSAGSGGGGGGGGADPFNSPYPSGAGGGVGLLGAGSNGGAGSASGGAGGGGSAGANGGTGNGGGGGAGGTFGGGGSRSTGAGAPGACRIIWGSGRSYPATGTSDV